jgi:hypothetical protein
MAVVLSIGLPVCAEDGAEMNESTAMAKIVRMLNIVTSLLFDVVHQNCWKRPW